MKYNEIENNMTMLPEALKNINRPNLDGKAGEFSGYTFWQYTNTDAICKILEGNCFWINNISGMNDMREADLHATEKEEVFIQCFCNSDTEKIPMWYLYGGIVGRGASIGLTPSVMLNYIRSIRYVTELVKDSKGNFVPGDKLFIGSDFELQVGWVFYTDDKRADDGKADKSRTIRVNYWNKFVNIPNAEEFYRGNYFVKDYPWEYEKEFRLVFINKTGRKIQKIRVDIPEEFRTRKDRKIKVRLAPEVRSDKDFEDYRDKILGAGTEYQVSVIKSKLKINMDLLGRNKNDINEHVKLHPDFLAKDVREELSKYYSTHTI